MKSFLDQYRWPVLLLLGIFLELSFQTCWLGRGGVYVGPLVWTLGGLLTVWSAWRLALRQPDDSTDEDPHKNRINLMWTIFGLGTLVFAWYLKKTINAYPADPMQSDILPSLQLYVHRLLGGETVYQPMQFPGWTVLPTYFPMMWLPYVLPEIVHVDYRWMAFAMFLGVIYLYFWKISAKSMPAGEVYTKIILPFFCLWMFIRYRQSDFGFAVELAPTAFYLLMLLGLVNRSRLLFAAGIVCCLMSRYAFTFWLPMSLIILWMAEGIKPALRVSLYVAVGILAVYIVPFLSKDWQIIANGLKYYDQTAIGQWQTQAWQQAGDKPFHLTRGLSFAIYFYDFIPGDVAHRLDINKTVHHLACLLAAIGLYLGYLVSRRKDMDYRLYLLIALKAYLIVFYGLLYVPFEYLYQLPFFISLALVFELGWKQNTTAISS